MRYLKFIVGISLLLLGVSLVISPDFASNPLKVIAGIILFYSAGKCVNRARTNRPLFPSTAHRQRLLNNAYQNKLWGIGGLVVFAAANTFLILGNHRFYGYDLTYPWTTMFVTFGLG